MSWLWKIEGFCTLGLYDLGRWRQHLIVRGGERIFTLSLSLGRSKACLYYMAQLVYNMGSYMACIPIKASFS